MQIDGNDEIGDVDELDCDMFEIIETNGNGKMNEMMKMMSVTKLDDNYDIIETEVVRAIASPISSIFMSFTNITRLQHLPACSKIDEIGGVDGIDGTWWKW